MKHKLLAGILVMMIAGLFMAVSCTPTGQQKDCVVMLGDSIFALTGAEPAALQELAGQKWRTYYVSGAQMQGGSIIAPGDIEDQLDRAINQGAIRTIIMDGGGNDFLLGMGTVAATEAELKAAWGRILTKASSVGVETIIFQGYYQTTTATASELAVNDKIIAWLPQEGAAQGIKIYTYNPHTDSWFTSRRPASYTLIDGIHPSAAASQHMAEMIWNLMVQNNIEQGEACTGGGGSGGCN
jgi:lysophospholipase L1-like esterase